MVAALVTVWVLAAVAISLGVGRAVRIADRREDVLPARLDPRAGQHAAKAAPGVFTALLLGVALVALGIAQQLPGGPA